MSFSRESSVIPAVPHGVAAMAGKRIARPTMTGDQACRFASVRMATYCCIATPAAQPKR
jgi:hypothetical protein